MDFRDLLPVQVLNYLKEMYVRACFDMTSLYGDGFKSRRKTHLAFVVADHCTKLVKNFNMQLEVMLKTSSSEWNIPRPTEGV